MDVVELGQEVGNALAQDSEIVTAQEVGLNSNSSDADVSDVVVVQASSEPTGVVRFFARCGINLILPFINGLMLGFGEILAHELGFKYGWVGARVSISDTMIP